MVKKTKTYREKLETDRDPKLTHDPKGKGLMLIPTPLMVNKVVCSIPKGKLMTMNGVRQRLARESGADYTCSLTSGIFLKIVAGAAEEELSESKKDVTPYWRVLRDNGTLNDKYPAGIERQAELLRNEGHEIITSSSGKKLLVKNYIYHLIE